MCELYVYRTEDPNANPHVGRGTKMPVKLSSFFDLKTQFPGYELQAFDPNYPPGWVIIDVDNYNKAVDWLKQRNQIKLVSGPLVLQRGLEMQQKVSILPGSVHAVLERQPNGQLEAVGTMVVVAPNGFALCARHCVVWKRDGKIHLQRLRVKNEDIRLDYIASWRDLDICLFKLKWCNAAGDKTSTGGSGSSGGGSASGSGDGSQGGGGSDSSSSSTQAAPWPFIKPCTGLLRVGSNVRVYGFPLVAEQEGLTPDRDGECFFVHGLVCDYVMGVQVGVADYDALPNMSGAPVVSTSTGELGGIHVCTFGPGPGNLDEEDEWGLSSTAADPPSIVASPEEEAAWDATVGAVPAPQDQGSSAQAVNQGTGKLNTAQLTERLKSCHVSLDGLKERVGGLEGREANKGGFSTFTTWAAIAARLKESGLLSMSGFDKVHRRGSKKLRCV